MGNEWWIRTSCTVQHTGKKTAIHNSGETHITKRTTYLKKINQIIVRLCCHLLQHNKTQPEVVNKNCCNSLENNLHLYELKQRTAKYISTFHDPLSVDALGFGDGRPEKKIKTKQLFLICIYQKQIV